MNSNSEQDNSTQLTPPVDEKRDHVLGAVSAPVTLVEYGDFECPDCGATYPVVTELMKRVGTSMRFVYRYYPLIDSHPHAEHAAEIAEAAAAQGKFWEMYSELYTHQKHLTDNDLISYAEKLGLDTQRIDREMQNETFTKRVEEDLTSGDASGVEGTPTFYINGVYYDDAYNVDALQKAIEKAADNK